MQGLVRARLARRALEGSNAEDESGGKLDEVGCISTTLVIILSTILHYS